MPLLAYSIKAFQSCGLVSEIIIVAREEKLNSVGEMCMQYGFNKVTKVMKGGLTRSESVMIGIFAASGKAKLIAIHDGARPCVEVDIIEKTIIAASKYHAAAPAVQVIPTIKRVENKTIKETVDRDGLFEIQTPQIFRAEIIKAALTNVMKKSIKITDDCMAAEIIGVPVYVVEGSRSNIKITDAEDLSLAEHILQKQKVEN